MGKPRRKRWSKGAGSQKKRGKKDPGLTKRRIKARIGRDQAKLEALEAAEKGLHPEPEPEEYDDLERDEYENRVVIKFFWKQLGSPTDPEEWKQRDGVISVIRRRMGKGAPVPRTVERTLQRLVEDGTAGRHRSQGPFEAAARDSQKNVWKCVERL